MPHRSWHDFYIGILLRKVTGIKTNFVAKKELLSWPLGYYFRAIGGAALDRTPGQNKVEAIAKLFEDKEEFRLTLAPEGTRKKVTEWRTGFYYIAKAARVPFIMFPLVFKHKENRISEPFYPSEDRIADFKYIKAFYQDVEGRNHDYT